MMLGDPSEWYDLFQQNLIQDVLELVVATWERMPKPGQSDQEDRISVQLFTALLKAKDRNKHAFLIRYQDVEVDTDLSKVTGQKDIVFFPGYDEEIYLCLEAKRLNAVVSGVRRSLADEYVRKGMQRFVDRKYSRSVRHGAMLAYVLDSDTARAMKNVDNNVRRQFSKLRMTQNSGLSSSTVRPEDPRTRETQHVRLEETTSFRIHHIFVIN